MGEGWLERGCRNGGGRNAEGGKVEVQRWGWEWRGRGGEMGVEREMGGWRWRGRGAEMGAGDGEAEVGKWELGVERQGCRGVRWWCTGGGVEESGERCMGIHAENSEDTEVGARWRDTGGIGGRYGGSESKGHSNYVTQIN